MNSALDFEMRLASGCGDEYGWAMGWFFPIAETLFLADEPIPAEWQYRPGAISFHTNDERVDSPDVSYEDNIVASLYVNGEISADELRHAGNVLSRYVNLLCVLGKDY